MKTFLPIAAALLIVPCTRAAIQSLPFADAFTYAEGNLYAVATGVWDAGGNSGSEITVSTAAALTSPSGFATASGNGIRWAPSGTARRAVVQFASVPNTDNNTVYVSFLVNVATSPSAAKLIAFLENSTSSTTSPQLGIFVDNTPRIGIGKKATSAAVWSGTLSAGVHLVVVRYTFLGVRERPGGFVGRPAGESYGTATATNSLGSTTGSSDPTALGTSRFPPPAALVRCCTSTKFASPPIGPVSPRRPGVCPRRRNRW